MPFFSKNLHTGRKSIERRPEIDNGTKKGLAKYKPEKIRKKRKRISTVCDNLIFFISGRSNYVMEFFIKAELKIT